MCKSLKKTKDYLIFQYNRCSLKKIANFLYSQRFRFSILFAICLHIFDLVTDIIVTTELYHENSPYFPTSIGILIFSFVGSAILSLDHDLFGKFVYYEKIKISRAPTFTKDLIGDLVRYILKGLLWMLLDIIQINYLVTSIIAFYYDDKNNYKLDINSDFREERRKAKIKKEYKIQLVNKRMIESLLESGPQALFQLFIILNQSSSKTFIDLAYYYLSVKISLLSLTYTLISMDHFYLTEFIYNIGSFTLPSYFSKYTVNSMIFRLTEVFSRVGLLACISQMYDGYYLFLFIFMDYLCINIFNVIKRYLRYKYENCEFSFVALKLIKKSEYIGKYRSLCLNNDILKQFLAHQILLRWKIYKKDSVKNIFRLKNIIKRLKIHYLKEKPFYEAKLKIIKERKNDIYKSKIGLELVGIKHIINNIRSLGVYYKPLSEKLIKQKNTIELKKFYNTYNFDINLPNYDKWWNIVSMNFISKYLNNLIISIIIIYKLLFNTYSPTIMLISISSIISFILNIISLYILTKWNYGDKNTLFEIITKPIINCKCKCLNLCFSCYGKKDKTTDENNDENNDQERNSMEQKI
jgi:hypothetical protein